MLGAIEGVPEVATTYGIGGSADAVATSQVPSGTAVGMGAGGG